MKKFLYLFFVSIFLTTIFTWPFATKLFSFNKDYGDWTFGSVTMWYHQYSLWTGRIFNHQQYFNGFLSFPHPNTLAYSDLMFIPSFVFAPFYFLTSDLGIASNFTAFLAFAFSIISAYLCINYFVKNKYASLIGALIFTFNPLAFSRFPLHLDLTAKYFLPPLFLFCYLYFKKPSLKNAFFFGLFFTLNGLSVNYFLITTTVFLPILFLPFLIANLYKKNFSYFVKLIKYGLICLIFLPILWYFFEPSLALSKKEGITWRIEQNVYFSARLIDYVSSSPKNFLYGNFVKSIDPLRTPKNEKGFFSDYQEHSLFLNLLPIFLFIFGIIFLIKSKRPKYLFVYLLISLFVSFILTLGPYFLGWNGDQGTLKLPYYYLFQILPFFRGMRVPSRIEYIFYLPFSLITSFGAFYFLNKFKKFKVPLFIIFILILFAENFTPLDYNQKSTILPLLKKIDSAYELAFLKDKGTLHLPVNFPEDWGKESAYLTWLTQTGEKIANGNGGYIPEDEIDFLTKIKKSSLDENILKEIRAFGTDYLIIHKNLMTPSEKENIRSETGVLKRGTVFDRDGIQILDLKKYNFQITKCELEKDFDIKVGPGLYRPTNQTFTVVLIKNKSNCYLQSPYENRYSDIDAYINGSLKTIYIRLPILIRPYEEVALTEINGEVRF